MFCIWLSITFSSKICTLSCFTLHYIFLHILLCILLCILVCILLHNTFFSISQLSLKLFPHHSFLQLDTSRSEIDAREVRYGTHAPDMAIILTFTHGILLSFDGTIYAILFRWFHPSFLTESAVIMAISHLSKFVKNSRKGGL